MFIVCPKCFFKRTVDAKQIPAAATMATCPRCEEKFRFRDPETGDYIEKICLEYQDEQSISHKTNLQNPTDKTQISTHAQQDETKAQIAQDSEHEPIADEILGEALQNSMENLDDSKKSHHTQAFKHNSEDSSEQHIEKASIKEDTSLAEQIITNIEDTSDEQPLREEEVAKPKELNEEDPLLDTNTEEQNTAKKAKKQERYQMISDDVPWEHPERYGIFGSLFHTIARVMFRAPEFFSTIHSQSSALRPALFYALLGLFQALCLQVWFSTLEAQLIEVAPQMQESVTALSTPLAIILSPFQAIFQLALYSAFLYLAVRITNPDKADFNLILRVVAYGYAPTILSIVPYVGPMVGLVWFVFNIVVGIRYALRLTWQKTFLALSPIFVLLAFIMSNVMSMFTL